MGESHEGVGEGGIYEYGAGKEDCKGDGVEAGAEGVVVDQADLGIPIRYDDVSMVSFGRDSQCLIATLSKPYVMWFLGDSQFPGYLVNREPKYYYDV